MVRKLWGYERKKKYCIRILYKGFWLGRICIEFVFECVLVYVLFINIDFERERWFIGVVLWFVFYFRVFCIIGIFCGIYNIS